MIREYSLSNFKAFGQHVSIPIRPITLIYAENSSGKSSIIQSLLLLKQTVEDSENRDILLAPKGRYVDLGGFREFIFAHDVSRTFTVSLSQSLAEIPIHAPEWIRDALRAAGEDALTLTIAFRYDERQANAVVESLKLLLGRGAVPLITYKPAKAEPARSSMLFAYGSLRNATDQTVLKVDGLNLDHPIWEKLWNKQRQRIVSDILPELRRQIDLFERRIGKFQELASQEQEEEETTRTRPLQRSRNRLVDLQRELEDLKKAENKWSTFTTEQAKEEFSKINKGTFLGISNLRRRVFRARLVQGR